MPAPTREAPPRIEDHRVIGDGVTVALVQPDATIDWWCTPSVDADPILWSLLDAAGGVARFVAADPVSFVPDPAGSSAITVLRVEDIELEVRDSLIPVTAGGSALVRFVRLAEPGTGPVTVRHLTRLGGFDAARPGPVGDAVSVAGQAWRVLGGVTTPTLAGDLLTEVVVDADGASLVVTSDPDVRLDPEALRQAVAKVDARHQEPLDAAALPAVHRQRAVDALAVMRACTIDRTGGILASPTTSVPEAPGAGRQWDYRYCWLRDGSLAAAVAASVGQLELAEGYLDFVERVGADEILSAPVFTVDGGAVPDEREIAGVEGWARSRPVRVGNAAAAQTQYDALGFLVEAISIVVAKGGQLSDTLWDVVRVVADRVATGDDEPTAGIWEMREPRRFVDADIGRWMALDHALRLSDACDRPASDVWRERRDASAARVRDAILPDGMLPQVHAGSPGDGEPVPDASALLAVICGLLPADDPVATGVVDAVIERLGAGPFLYRYPPGDGDGLEGREGVFLPASWWAVTALATLGRLDEANARADAMCAVLPRLMPEELDPETGRGLGNVPLVWAHIEALRALNAIETAR
jgi:hypothetical protein